MMQPCKNRKETALVHISEEMFSDVPLLRTQLIGLYMSIDHFEYQLDFDLFYLPILNRIFDEIIFKYGYQKVFFRFPSHCDFYSFKNALAGKGLR